MKNSMYLKHESGAQHELKGRRLAALRREILAGRGGPEVTSYIESGYVGFLDRNGEITALDALDTSAFTEV